MRPPPCGAEVRHSWRLATPVSSAWSSFPKGWRSLVVGFLGGKMGGAGGAMGGNGRKPQRGGREKMDGANGGWRKCDSGLVMGSGSMILNKINIGDIVAQGSELDPSLQAHGQTKPSRPQPLPPPACHIEEADLWNGVYVLGRRWERGRGIPWHSRTCEVERGGGRQWKQSCCCCCRSSRCSSTCISVPGSK